jgi:hypothetical protein
MGIVSDKGNEDFMLDVINENSGILSSNLETRKHIYLTT